MTVEAERLRKALRGALGNAPAELKVTDAEIDLLRNLIRQRIEEAERAHRARRAARRRASAQP